MVAVVKQDLTISSGDSESFAVPVTTSAGGLADLRGAAVTWIAARWATQEIVITKTPTLLHNFPTATDQVLVELDPADTAALDDENLYHELEIVDLAGKVSTVLIGSLVVRRDFA